MRGLKNFILNLLYSKTREGNKDKYKPLKIGELSVSIPYLFEHFPPKYYNAYKSKIGSQIKSRWIDGTFSFEKDILSVSQHIINDSDFIVDKSYDTVISHVDYFFDYKASDKRTTVWYLNFADPNIFVAYGSDLFVQDEIQCLEHPLLGSLREYMISSDIYPLSVFTRKDTNPTPILIENVPYMVEIRTSLSVNGIHYSIYGNNFCSYEISNPSLLDMAIHVKEKTTSSNIIAMCAPFPETGKYSMETIRYLLLCAMTAFGAAKERNKAHNTEIHTGRWGAGAFGGNEELAIIVQILAGNICGIQDLVFHAVSTDKLNAAKDRCKAIFKDANDYFTFSDLVKSLYSIGYEWGESDGN